MTSPTKTRIESIDLLKGLVMVIMALDHVRDYFHYDAFFFEPTDPLQSNLTLFFTRWITHFCAPLFSFLAGLSAFMVGRRKTKSELSIFLLQRGIWLVLIELTVVNFSWFFDLQFRTPVLAVIWSLGISMVVLSALIYLPKNAILVISCAIIASHNLLDDIHFPGNIFYSILHEFSSFSLPENRHLLIVYPIIPWVATMSLGYYFGNFYTATADSFKRKKIFNIIGICAIVLFCVLRLLNVYGDPTPWQSFTIFAQTVISFLNPSKYPPSLLYVLMTLGVAFIFLANTENLKGSIVNFFSLYGRVPFFYYIVHFYLIHVLALVYAQFTGFGWQSMVLTTWVNNADALKGFGVNLFCTYLIWIGVVAALYPVCKIFDQYKQTHKEIWWLSYL